MNFHVKVREKINNFWNEKMNIMKPYEVMELIEAF